MKFALLFLSIQALSSLTGVVSQESTPNQTSSASDTLTGNTSTTVAVLSSEATKVNTAGGLTISTLDSTFSQTNTSLTLLSFILSTNVPTSQVEKKVSSILSNEKINSSTFTNTVNLKIRLVKNFDPSLYIYSSPDFLNLSQHIQDYVLVFSLYCCLFRLLFILNLIKR